MDLLHVVTVLLPILLLVPPQSSATFCTNGDSCLCNDIYAPVCSLTGCSYLNKCRLICAGAVFLKSGECHD